MKYSNTLPFSKAQDTIDPLRKFRTKFLFPKHKGKDVIYFTGNSLGLQPRSTAKYIQQELSDWAKYGVEGHFQAKHPWFSYHELFAKPVSKIVGAKSSEVIMMNQLTSNIHFLFVSFYCPTKERYKILCEAKAFPSDQYVLESQVKFHGYAPDDAIIEVAPRKGEHTIRHEDVLSAIEKNKNELALVFIGGVNYYSGQVFDMQSITEVAHNAGAMVGFDLAHAAGNIKLNLHDWNVDFAAWCTYKYLNSGPGSVGGAFVHERHHTNDLSRFAGWWGHDKSTRFKMEKGFKPIPTAESWALSNVPIISMACHKAAVDIFEETGMNALAEKSKKLTGYLEFVIEEINLNFKNKKLEIITPKERGCQLSMIAHGLGKPFHEQLTRQGVIADWREPNVIRMAPVPLYNSFEDVYRFGEIVTMSLRTK
ncbi:MAG: kynureninase [Bacteroidetes bacterium]|nr:kynureninase [Bacteroidota bacterium]